MHDRADHPAADVCDAAADAFFAHAEWFFGIYAFATISLTDLGLIPRTVPSLFTVVAIPGMTVFAVAYLWVAADAIRTLHADG